MSIAMSEGNDFDGYVEPRCVAIASDKLVALRDCKSLPSSPNRGQVNAWMRRGIKNRNTGQRIKLPVVNIGGTPHTSEESFQWFINASNAGGES
jgi:hypothetical protein